VHSDLFDFIKANFPNIMKWKGENVNAEGFYKEISKNSGAPQPSNI
jgi:hypothetical protein